MRLFNLFLYVAVPAVWGQESIRKHWWDTEYFTEGEDETEIISDRLNEED